MFPRHHGRPAPGVEFSIWCDETELGDHVVLAQLPHAGRAWLIRADIVVGMPQSSSAQAWAHVDEILAALPGCTVAAAGCGPGRCVVRVRDGRGLKAREPTTQATNSGTETALRYARRCYSWVCSGCAWSEPPRGGIEVRRAETRRIFGSADRS